MLEVKVPAVGESVTQGVILQWFKKEGEVIQANENLYELETDKITMPIASESAGILSIKKPAGATVLVGETVATLRPQTSASAPASPPLSTASADPAAPAAPAAPASSAASAAPAAPASSAASASPAASAAPAAAAPSGPAIDIAIPVVGESITQGVILQWYKKSGDYVQINDNLYELETDKITMPVASEFSGTITILVPAKSTVAIQQVVARLQPGAAPALSAPPSSAIAAPAASAAPAAPSSVVASPAARFHAEQHQLPLASVQGTGKDGRVMKEDVLRTLQNPPAPAPSTAPTHTPAPAAPPAKAPAPAAPLASSAERQRREPMTSIRKRIAERLVYAQQTAAMLTTFNELDMTALMDLRTKYNEAFAARHGIKLGFMSFFVKAAVEALKLVPAINAYIDGEDIVYNHFYDIGIAVGTDKGLVVPIVRDADKLSFAGIEKGIADLAKRARDRKLTLQDLSGASFTITNGGIYGSLLSTPILNPPQSGILGMHGIKKRPVVINDKVEIRPMMYVAMTYDHRIVDGKEAVTFLKRIVECVENPERLLLEV